MQFCGTLAGGPVVGRFDTGAEFFPNTAIDYLTYTSVEDAGG